MNKPFPLQTMLALGRLWPVYAVLLLTLLGQGCRSMSGVAPSAPPAGPVLFPPPPEAARVQYLGSITSAKDLPNHRSRFTDFILGPEPEKVSPVKPNKALLVGNRLYICDTVLNTVLVLDLVSGEVRALEGDAGNGKIKQPNSITRDEEGNFYIADKVRQAVLVYDAKEQFVRALGHPGESAPVDVAVGAKAIYICNIDKNRIEIWDKQTGAVQKMFGERGSVPGKFYMPSHVALDHEGNVYVTDTGNFRVQKFSPEGEHLMTIGGHGDAFGKFAWPKGIDIDNNGRIYVVDSRFFNVQIFDPQGKLLLFFGGPGRDNGCLEIPSGLTVQPWPSDVPWLSSRLSGGFDPEFLATVVSQQGEGMVNFFAIARDKTGKP